MIGDLQQPPLRELRSITRLSALTPLAPRVIDHSVTTSAPAPTARNAQRRAYTRRAATWAGILLVLAAALLYTRTLDRWLTWGDLAGGDLITHQYAQVQARPSNAPGYPLYTMGGWLWFHGLRATISAFGPDHPNPIPILAAYSTLWALLAIWLLYRTLCFLTSSRYWPESPWGGAGNWPLAVMLGAFYGVTYFFWYYATTTEQYSSAIAQTLAIVYIYLLWAEADAAAPAHYALRSRAGWLLVLLALLCGISLAHMLTVALIVPPLVGVVIWQRPSLLRNGWLVAAVILAALLPLTAYVYVFIRGAQHPEWWGAGEWQSAAEWFRAFVSTAQGREELGWGFEPGRTFFGNGFPALIGRELSAPMLLAGLAGIALLKRRTATLLYGTLAIYLVFTWAYRYGNWFQVILPAYPLLLLGVGGLSLRLSTWPLTANRRWVQPALLLLLAGAVGWRFGASWPQADASVYPPDEALGHAAVLLADDLPPRAALFAEQGDAASLDYLAQIWGLRPDIRVIGSSRAEAAIAAGRPLLATWGSAGTLIKEMGGGAHTVQTQSADWARIDAAPPAAAGGAPSALNEPAGVPVLGEYSTTASPSGAPITGTQPGLDVDLLWQLPDGGWPEGLALSLRPTQQGAFIADPSSSSGAILQVDAAAPLHGLVDFAPATPVLADAYRLPLLEPLPAGADGLAIILYRSVEGGFETITDLRLPLHP